MSSTVEYLANNVEYAKSFKGPLPLPPAKQTAVLACMDARLDPQAVLGLKEGDSHVIRNAGGVVSEDALRSLVISQRLLGTKEIILIHHTDCGMLTFKSDELSESLAKDTGIKPSYHFHAFADLATDVRQGINKIKNDPHILNKDNVCGFIFDVATGKLEEVKEL